MQPTGSTGDVPAEARRGPARCPACDATGHAVSGAWCGSCGARVGVVAPADAGLPTTATPTPDEHTSAGRAATTASAPVTDDQADGGGPTTPSTDAGSGAPVPADDQLRRALLCLAVVVGLVLVALADAVSSGRPTTELATGTTTADRERPAPTAQPSTRPEPLIRTLDDGSVVLPGGLVVASDHGSPPAASPAHGGRTPSEPPDSRVVRLPGDRSVHLDAGALVVSDDATGRELSRASLSRLPDGGALRLLGAAADTVVGATGDGRLVGVDLAGRVRWVAPTRVGPPRPDAIGSRWLVAPWLGDGPHRHALVDLRDGRVVRTVPSRTGDPGPRVVAVDDAPPLVVSVDGSHVVAWDAATGAEVWRADPRPRPDDELVLADATDVVAVLVGPADASTGTSILRLAPGTGRVHTTAAGPGGPPSAAGVRQLWDADAEGVAVVHPAGVTVTPWLGEPELRALGDVRAVELTPDAFAVVRPGDEGERVELHRRHRRGLVVAVPLEDATG